MNYYEAFNLMIDKFGLTLMNDNFLVRSFLSDLIGNSYNDTQLLNAFNLLNKQSLYLSIHNYSLTDSKNHIKSLINKSDKRYTIEQYIHSVEPLLLILYPNEYVLYRGRANNNGNSIKINRVNKPNGKVVQIVKHTPTPTFQPTPTPKPKPKRKKKLAPIEAVSITANCKELLVTYGNDKEIMIYKGGIDVTPYIKSLVRVNAKFIEIDDYRGLYTVSLPKGLYQKLKISYVGKRLDVNSKGARRMIVNEVSISCPYGESYISTNSKDVYIIQRKGKVIYRGKVNNLHMRKGKNVADITFHNGGMDDLEIAMAKESINLAFLSHKLTHNPYSPYFKLKKVDWTYKLGPEKVRLTLYTKRGRILII